MNSLELEWETFDFYTVKIQKQEAIHVSKLSLIKSFLSKDYSFSERKRGNLLDDYNKCCSHLLLLYKKQLDSVSNLIVLNRDCIDIPVEREVGTENLLELKNITATLIEQVIKHKEDMGSMLGSDEDFDF